jgi:hypothetical protein
MLYNNSAAFPSKELLLGENVVCSATIAGITRITQLNVVQNTILLARAELV